MMTRTRLRAGTTAIVAAILGTSTAIAVQPMEATAVSPTEPTDMTKTEHTRKPNRLIDATSPYLLQHAHNPVDWHEWSDEAFAKAKTEDRPIFLSIGYAACHWCHVMEHESFENTEVAELLNAHFVSVKVDREERPDIDELYMAYTQARTGHGGWPMSVWLMPDGTPFFAGTYFRRDQFVQLLTRIQETWTTERKQITEQSANVRAFFDEWAAGTGEGGEAIPQSVVDQAAKSVARHFDRSRGGISGGGTNKFPPSMALDLMLRVYRRTGDADLIDAVTVTLDKMARGGIYDHVGGGICRYSTDVDWLVPHFEKMLYDQAMVSSIYLDAYQAAKNPLYAEVAADIFDYVISDLQSPEGGFYSSRDADSEGLEGKFYIWTVQEIREVLGDDEAKLCCAYYDVTEVGNWFERLGHAPPGPKNILHVTKTPEQFAKLHDLNVNDLKARVNTWRGKLREARSKRAAPGLDDKILTGWNGLMIAGLAKGAAVLDRPNYAEAAAKAADFLLRELRKDGRLFATYRNGRARLTGYLTDYAFLVDGLLNLHEASADPRWLDAALALTETSITYFHDPKSGGFFFTASDGEKLLARSKQPHDGAIPSGNSVHASNLLRLAVLFDRKDLREKAESIFTAFGDQVRNSPGAFERLLCAADFHTDRVKEIVIVGDPGAPETGALIRAVHDRYLPNKIVLQVADRVEQPRLPLLVGKARVQGRATAYVCEGYTCKRPVTTVEDLIKELYGK